MHHTALLTGQAFFSTYVRAPCSVLDVGSCDVNGTLKQFVPVGGKYTGIDIASGPNVDVVLDDPYQFPFENDSFDFVISTSCLEHAEFFWLTFLEMARVVKSGGFIYFSVPSNGPVHRHPQDYWRFYPDAGLALAHWVRWRKQDITLIESFFLSGSEWRDFVAIFGKPTVDAHDSISDRFSEATDRIFI